MMRLVYWLFGGFMRRVEEGMILRLLRQRDEARGEIDRYRREAGMRLGEFLPDGEKPRKADKS